MNETGYPETHEGVLVDDDLDIPQPDQTPESDAGEEV